MKKIKIKPFLAVFSVFLISASVFIPTQRKIAVSADGIDINGPDRTAVLHDIMNFDWIRTVSVDTNDQHPDIDYYNSVISFPTSFFVPIESESEPFYSSINVYTYSPDFSIEISSSADVQYIPNSLSDFLDYGFDLNLYGLYTFNKNSFFMYSNEIVIQNDRIDYLENYFNLSYFYVNGFAGTYSIKNMINNAHLSFTVSYYDYGSKTLEYIDCFFDVSSDEYFTIQENNIDAWHPFDNFLDYLNIGSNNEANRTGFLTLSDIYLTFDFNYEQVGPPIQLHYYSRAVDSFTYPAIIDIYSNKIYSTPITEIRVSDFIVTAVSGFLDFYIMPGLTFGSILAIMIAIPLVIAFLKYFAGG